MDEPIKVKVTIHGRVQGVFFRAFTRDEAVARQLNGYVKNLSNGSVEALFQGPAPAVKSMLNWCRQGSPASRVTRVTQSTVQSAIDYSEFQIQY